MRARPRLVPARLDGVHRQAPDAGDAPAKAAAQVTQSEADKAKALKQVTLNEADSDKRRAFNETVRSRFGTSNPNFHSCYELLEDLVRADAEAASHSTAPQPSTLGARM